MIKVTKINGTELVVNADFVEVIECTPDTIVTLNTGKKLILKDTVDEIVKKIIDYKKSMGDVIKVIDKSIPREN